MCVGRVVDLLPLRSDFESVVILNEEEMRRAGRGGRGRDGPGSAEEMRSTRDLASV